MAIDPYSPCPCGTGKKVKFCCPDLVHELNEIQNMLEGGQRQACLDYIESVEKKHPDRACLVTTRALLESALGNEKKAEQTLEGYLAKDPTNPVALAELAVVYAAQRGATAGIEPLQKALNFDTDVVSGRVVMSIARLGEMLLMDGQVLAARGHFMLAYILYPQDEGTLQLLARFFGSPQIPLALKNEQSLDAAPADAAWKSEFDAAIADARRGRWWRAADVLKKVSSQAPNDPTLWHDLAVLRSWLADLPGTVAALRKYASLDVPFDDAVEAEALAQLIDTNAPVDSIDELKVTFNVDDFDKVSETLAGDKRAAPFAWQSLGLDFGDQPPPQAGYFLLDRPIPATGKDIARQDIPHIIGRLLLFGRQTDRPARIEATVRSTLLTQLEESLKNLVGDLAKRTGEPEEIDDIPVAEAALSWSWRLPDDVPQEHVRKLVEEQRRDAILNGWTSTKLKILGDKSPQEAAGDPTQTIRLAAAVSLVEQSFAQPSTEGIFDELRAKLHLPAAGLIEPKPNDPMGVPYTRAHRLDIAKLSDEDLVRNFQRALQVVARTAVRKLGLAIVERPSLKGKVDLAGVYGSLAEVEGLSDDAVKFLGEAKKAAVEQKQSCAQWDLEELQVRLRRGEAAEFGRLIDHLQSQHIREPGVGQALMQILYEAGIVGADGRPRGMPGGGGTTINGVSLGGEPAMPAAAEDAGKLWTPGSEAAPAPGGGKSGLWVPGMD
jgi:tetratricopeptide (TPR) repeat protein